MPAGGGMGMSSSPLVTQSETSHLLSDGENALLVKMLGPRAISLATAVVQVRDSELLKF